MAAGALLAFADAERDAEEDDFSDRAYVGGMLIAEGIEIMRLFHQAYVEAGKKAKRRG